MNMNSNDWRTKLNEKRSLPSERIADEPDAPSSIHDCKLIKIAGDHLMTAWSDGKNHSLAVGPDTKVTCDGADCRLEDLKEGSTIRLTTRAGDKNAVIRIEATRKNGSFTSC